MTQITIWDELKRVYNREYYRANRTRRLAQRMASKWGNPKEWRTWLPHGTI